MTDTLLNLGILFTVIAFLSGSVPYGLVYSALRGVDIRKVGSGNIGATNVTRQFGLWQGFVPVLILDMAKGIVPLVLFNKFASSSNQLLFDSFQIIVGMAAVLGHIFSPFLRFKGGKGVATTGGVLFAWNFIVASCCLGVFAFVFFTFGKKIVGRASVVAAISLPIITLLVPTSTLPLKIITIVLSFLILLAHKKNILEWKTGEDLAKKQQKKSQQEK